jgi:hypothetical protein
MTFKRTTDFTFTLVYKDSQIPILTATITGVDAAHVKLNGNGKRFIKGPVVKAVMKIDSSGMITVGEVYMTAEMTAKKESFLGSIFGGVSKDEEGKVETDDTKTEVCDMVSNWLG